MPRSAAPKFVHLLLLVLAWLAAQPLQAAPADWRRLADTVVARRAAVADTLAERAARRQPVEALILFDDTVERVRLRAALGGRPDRERVSRADYERATGLRRELLRALKNDVLLSAGDPDVEVLADYDQLPIVHARIGSARALDNLRRQGRILAVDDIVAVRPVLAQSLPLIHQAEVQAAGHLGTGTTVAVLDTGVDYTRAAFGSCGSPGGACKVVHAQDFAAQDNALDANGHGTNVAGIVLGVAPGARVAALDVFESNGLAYSNAIISAINWCIANKAAHNIVAINMSLGGGRHTSALAPSDAWGTAIANAVNAGIVVVAASGNNGYVDALSSPAAYSNVVSVGALYDSNMGSMGWSGCSDSSTAAGKVTCFSNSASFLTMAAPGALISAAGLVQGGTSQASPHVAGAVAVLKSSYAEDTVAQTIARLKLGDGVTDHRNGVRVPQLDLAASTAVPPATYLLSVTRAGAGSGTVTAASAGISCGGTCAAGVTNGASVTLTALHGANSMFNGWSGACTGSQSTCTVAMTSLRSVTATFGPRSAEDLLPGGGLPAGWAPSAGAAAGWSAVAGGAFVGTHALKAAAVGHGQTAGIAVAGRFAAGVVSFARRVSSESGADQLRFYIDDELQGSWSGEVAWGMVSFPITAGEHTLKWTYEKSAAGVAGADTAWIDSVHLPWSIVNPRAARHDLDGDGRADVLWRHAGTGNNIVWRMGGPLREDGSGSTAAVADLGWRIAATDDLDGDGRAEVLWRHAATGRNLVWRMDGVSRVATSELAALADLKWVLAGTGDFDGDGKADLLWRHGQSGRNYIWRMDGATRLASTEIAAVADVGWRVAAVADFDGDGKADIVWRHGATGRNILWRMDGSTRLASTELAQVADLRWAIVGGADVDGDGKADLLWRHAGTGANTLWRMDGAVRIGSTALPVVTDLAWQVAGVADFDGDGKADILWRHAASGRNLMWLMDGATRRASHELEPVTDLRWQVAAP